MSAANAANHISFDPSPFKPEAISAETLAANEAFWRATSGGPDWWDLGQRPIAKLQPGARGRFRVPRNPRGR
jgi:hypothetical protein